MSKISFTLAVILTLGLPLSSQSFAAKVSDRREIGPALDFEVPSIHVSGTLIADAGHRLVAVTMALGDEPIETEVRRFALIASTGRYEPIGAGASADSLIPLDRIPLNKEVGVILPSNAIVSLTRESATRVVLEVGPLGQVAFLYQVPTTAAVRSLRMPDGRELTATP